MVAKPECPRIRKGQHIMEKKKIRVQREGRFATKGVDWTRSAFAGRLMPITSMHREAKIPSVRASSRFW